MPAKARKGAEPSSKAAASRDDEIDPELVRLRDAEAERNAAVVPATYPDAELDPDLVKIRDEEAKALAAIKVEPRPEPTIDPELVKARDEEIKRGDKTVVSTVS